MKSFVIALFLGEISAVKLESKEVRQLPPYGNPYYNDHWRFCNRDDERYCGNDEWNESEPKGYGVYHPNTLAHNSLAEQHHHHKHHQKSHHKSLIQYNHENDTDDIPDGDNMEPLIQWGAAQVSSPIRVQTKILGSTNNFDNEPQYHDYEDNNNIQFDHDADTDDIPEPDVTHPVGVFHLQTKYDHGDDTDDIPEPDITHPVRMNMAQKKRFEHSDDTEDIPEPDVAGPIKDYDWKAWNSLAQKNNNDQRKVETYPAKDSHSKAVPYVVRDHAWNHDQQDHTHDASWDQQTKDMTQGAYMQRSKDWVELPYCNQGNNSEPLNANLHNAAKATCKKGAPSSSLQDPPQSIVQQRYKTQ